MTNGLGRTLIIGVAAPSRPICGRGITIMTEHSHAEHRAPIDQDPSTLGAPPPHTTLLGSFYPMNDILAVVDDRTKGEQTLKALKAAGVPDSEVDLLDGAWFADAVRGVQSRGGIAGRLARFLSMDEQLLAQRYVSEAQQGRYIIVVHAEQPDQIAHVSAVLAKYGAHEARHYGATVITDLWPAAHWRPSVLDTRRRGVFASERHASALCASPIGQAARFR
jgi:hypothetical protein